MTKTDQKLSKYEQLEQNLSNCEQKPNKLNKN